jgi:hypothetical protein
MGLVRRFSRPLTYFFGLCPVVLHDGHSFYDVQSSARRSARGAGNHGLRSVFFLNAVAAFSICFVLPSQLVPRQHRRL